ncbi:MAG: hypothetical protein ACM3N9_06095, partial [Syntrophothermus sp.]
MARQISTLRANSFREEPVEEKPPVIPEETGKKSPRKKKEPKEKKPKAEKTPKAPKEKKPSDGRNLRVFGLFCLLAAVYLLLAFVSYTQTWMTDYDYAHKVINNFRFKHFIQ